MRTMVSAHPQPTIAPETLFLNLWWRRYRLLHLELDRHFETFWQAFVQNERFPRLGISPGSVLSQLETKSKRTFKAVFESLIECYAEKMGKPRWGEKTPGHFAYLDTLLTWYLQAKVLYLIRDPRAVVASVKNTPWSEKNADVITHRWRRAANILARWEHDNRVHSIKYESLVTNSTEELEAICAHLDVTFDASMLSPSEESSPIISQTGWRVAHLKKALQSVTSESVERWRSELDKDDIAAIETLVRSEMERFGYASSGPLLSSRKLLARGTSRRLSRLRARIRTAPGKLPRKSRELLKKLQRLLEWPIHLVTSRIRQFLAR